MILGYRKPTANMFPFHSMGVDAPYDAFNLLQSVASKYWIIFHMVKEIDECFYPYMVIAIWQKCISVLFMYILSRKKRCPCKSTTSEIKQWIFLSFRGYSICFSALNTCLCEVCIICNWTAVIREFLSRHVLMWFARERSTHHMIN